MVEHGICDHCKDPKNPVTAKNGGTLSTRTGGRKTWVADIHTGCKDAWRKANGAAEFAGLDPSLEPHKT